MNGSGWKATEHMPRTAAETRCLSNAKPASSTTDEKHDPTTVNCNNSFRNGACLNVAL